MNGHNHDNTEASAVVVSTAADNNGLPRRRIIVGGGASPSSLTPTTKQTKQNVSYNHNNCNEQSASDQKKSIQHNLQRHQRRILLYCQKKSKWVILLSTAVLLLMVSMTLLYAFLFKPMFLDQENLTPASFFRCSSLLHPSKKPKSKSMQQQHQQQSTNNIILTASHLRHGSDGQMRLRIIEHNLYYLLQSSSSSSDSSDSSTKNNSHQQQAPQFKSILIFSLDEEYETEIKSMVNEWLHQLHPSISTTIIQQEKNENENNNNILYVPNDAILVDAYKWITALETIPNLLYTIRHAPNTRVMLLNDSFLLTRPTPELFSNTNNCGREVCGLGWTAPKHDPTRHFQSYVRTLSSCSIERYMNFYYKVRDGVHNVNELIVLFEINLDWARTRRKSSSSSSSKGLRGDVNEEEEDDDSVSAMYEYVGAHPDEDYAQKVRCEVYEKFELYVAPMHVPFSL